MRTWHIAALVIVGLIVAGIAYAMYEKKRGTKRRLSGGGESAILENNQRQKDNPPIMPGPKKAEKQTNGTQTGFNYGGAMGAPIYGPTRKTWTDQWATDYGTFDDLGKY